MIDALCKVDDEKSGSKDNKVFSIFEFKALHEAKIDKLRYSLFCPACKQKAYFRKASSDGKQACFGSRYHETDCIEFNPSLRKAEEQKQVAEVERLIVEAESLQIDFSVAVTKRNKAKETAKRKTSASTVKVIKDDQVSINKQGLKKLLLSLLRGSSLANSDLWIYTSETHKWRAKNLFVNVNDAKPTDNGAPRMYWGTISHADKTINWLNPAEERSVSIPLSKYQTKFVERFDIQESRDVEGAGFIIFAKCVESQDKKRKFLQLWGNDLSYFYLSKAEE